MKHIVSGSRTAVLALGIALMLGSGASKADEATPPGKKPLPAEVQRLLDELNAAIEEREEIEAKAADTRSDDEVRHVALDHPGTEGIAGLKAKSTYLADALEGSRERLGRERVARMEAEAKDPANAPYWWEDDSSYERFELWADCKPMRVGVGVEDEGKAAARLTEESVRSAVESRMRAARLYSDEGTGLWLDVLVDRRAGGPFLIAIVFRKIQLDMETGQRGLSVSWRTGSFGTGALRSFHPSRTHGQILAAYLRVNEEAWARRSRRDRFPSIELPC